MKIRRLTGFIVRNLKFFGVIVVLLAAILSIFAIVKWGSDGALVVASAGTMAATAVLAMFNLRLVDVTKALTPAPAIVITLAFNTTHVFLDLHNAGSGAAVDIDVTIEWKAGNNVEVEGYCRQWRAAILPPGGCVRFIPRFEYGIHLQADVLKQFDRVTVCGTMSNSRGEPLNVCGRIEDPWEIYDLEVRSGRKFSSSEGP